MTVNDLYAEAANQPTEARAELVGRLDESLLADGWGPPPDIAERTQAELELRVAESDADPDSGASWAEVVGGMKRRRKRRAELVTALARLHASIGPHPRPFRTITADDRTALRRGCLRRLGNSLPVGYSQLLRVVDGFVYNGLSVYAAAPRPAESVPGFIEENVELRADRPDYADYLVFGHNDMDHLVYRISDGAYLVVARGGDDVFEVHDSFDELLLSALTKAL